MEDKEIKKIIKEAIEKDYNKFFIDGLMTGYKAALRQIYKEAKSLTSAKSIHEMIKNKLSVNEYEEK